MTRSNQHRHDEEVNVSPGGLFVRLRAWLTGLEQQRRRMDQWEWKRRRRHVGSGESRVGLSVGDGDVFAVVE
jgi:hypothetical protein